MDNQNFMMEDFEIGDEIVYTDRDAEIYYHGKISKFEAGRLHFEVYKKFDLDDDELMRDYIEEGKSMVGSVGEQTLYRLSFLHGKPDKRQTQLGDRYSKALRSVFIDLAIDTKDDQWLQLLKDDSWKKELLEA